MNKEVYKWINMNVNIILDINNHNLIKLFNILDQFHNLLELYLRVEKIKEKNIKLKKNYNRNLLENKLNNCNNRKNN
jgi:hypothetical protein